MTSQLLTTLLLKKLSERPRSGYQLIKEIKESTGWRPSCGTIYPKLNAMQREGLVTFKEDGRRKVYHLTSKGRRAYEELKSNQEELVEKIRGTIKLLNHMMGIEEKDGEITEFMINAVQRGEIPFKEVLSASFRLKRTILELARKGVLQREKRVVSGILDETRRKLEKLWREEG